MIIPIEKPSPSFNITLEELKELANNFIDQFIKEYPEIPIDSFEQGRIRFKNLPADIILFSLVTGTENYIMIGFKKNIPNHIIKSPYTFHYRKVIILSDKNWYVAPEPKDKTLNKSNFRYILVDSSIIKTIADQLKNSFEDDSEGRYINGLCVNGTRNNELGY